ncbi:hypothetical protein NX059_003009 [Plenodomus lindquistii]|nr:hypothetical protein NX059_003009 [Plenodomus lindquistii]
MWNYEAASNPSRLLKQQFELNARESATPATDYRISLIRYARADCLQLCTRMLEKLPIELRKLVYLHLCIEDRPILVGPQYHSRPYDKPPTQSYELIFPSEQHSGADVDEDDEEIELEDLIIETPDGRLKRDHTCKPPSDMVLPSSHIFNPRYVGPITSFELQKLYYTSNTFSICTVEQGIRNFLQLHTGFAMRKWRDGAPPSMPASLTLQPPFLPADYVCDLQIRIKAEHLSTADDWDPHQHKDLAQPLLLKSISDNLRGLYTQSLLTDGRSLKVEFVIMSELGSLSENASSLGIRSSQLRNIVKPAVSAFIHGRSNCIVKVTRVDDSMSPFPRDETEKFLSSDERQ